MSEILHGIRKSVLKCIGHSGRNLKIRNMATLETLHFDNLALKKLPIDSVKENYVRSVSGACFSLVSPTPVLKPKTVAYSKAAMELLDLDEEQLKRGDFAEYMSGNKILPGSETAAHCYCGHQFGSFSGQLGDGAAMYLGEIINKKGERWEIQLKGAGLTPYSRQADGRKVLRSSIREFLCSEAMHFLGIPTTRAGSCVTSDSKVVRDMFYNGNPSYEKCSIVSRIAPTFLRFGSFEIFKTLNPITGRRGPSVGRKDILLIMLNYTIETFYPEIYNTHIGNPQNQYKAFLKEVIHKTAILVAEWQCVGFCHGVLNTDNMSILGLTLDYGPFGFMDMYDPNHICNSSDDNGRYSYINQPEICLWNCQKLAEAIKDALPLSESAPLLESFNSDFELHYLQKMRKKLGLLKEHENDKNLIQSFLDTMKITGADFTNSFRCLSTLPLLMHDNCESTIDFLKEKLLQQCYSLETLIKLIENYMSKRHVDMLLALMQVSEEMLEQITGGTGLIQNLIAHREKLSQLQKMSQEEKQEQDAEHWISWLKEYVPRLQKELEDVKETKELEVIHLQRVQIMNNNNPRYVLRNYMAQNAITKAETGDFSEVRRLLKLLETPYVEQSESQDFQVQTTDDNASSSTEGSSCGIEAMTSEYDLPPQWAFDIKVS